MEMLEEHRCFGGWQQRWRHHAATLNCAMTFSIFLPPTQDNEPPPVLYWLSGLTCNDENFTTKAGAQRIAAELGIVLVMPDTSPRGERDSDQFLADQLQPAVLAEAARQTAWPMTLRIQPGYDHSYYFIASFIEDHLRFHARYLRGERETSPT